MHRGVSITVENGRRIVKGLGYHEPRKVSNLKELVKNRVKKYGNAVGFKFKDKEGKIIEKTYVEFNSDIDCLGTALISLGLKDKNISIIGENRYEWGVCYLSIVNGTGIAVPLDKYLPKIEVENLIERGKVEAIFYSPAYQQIMDDLAKTNNRIKYFICMEDFVDVTYEDSRFVTLPELIEKGRTLLDAGDRSFVDAPIDENKMTVLLFTSGTTSMSKGVMLSHANLAANVTGISTVLYAGPGDVYLSLLPLHHTFENTIGLLYMVHCGVCVAYCDGIKYVAQNLKEYNVTLLVAVPAILEAVYRRVKDGIKKSGKEKLFNILLIISDILRFIGIDVRRKLFKNIFNQLGPGLRLSVSGAAPLNPEVITFFNRIGLKLLEGYGLTETSPVVTTNNDFVNKPGTVGYPLAGIEVSIDSPDENGMGEIIVRGANVMLGYYEDEKATGEAISADGWFRTGDLGIIDEEGFLKITGRAKSMIVLANGKKAFPEEYEALLNNIPGVKESFVWGNKAPDGDVEICAKLVIDKEKLEAERGKVPAEEELANYFSTAIKEINKTIPRYKIIRYFVMSTEDVIKTTTLKIKRSLEYDKIKALLDKAGLDMRSANGKFLENLIPGAGDSPVG